MKDVFYFLPLYLNERTDYGFEHNLECQILGDYSQPDIPELNAVSQFVQLDTCNNSQSHFANLDADFMTLDNQDELQVTDFYSLCDYQDLDQKLDNLPRQIYLERLLELSQNSEEFIISYRSYLANSIQQSAQSSQPDTQADTRKLVTRRTTSNSKSIFKYASDCYILYMYIQGENVKIDDLFTKDKGTQNRTKVNTSNMSAEITVPKSSLVDLRSTLQTLIQRVHDLESKHTKCEETIQSLNKSVSELKAQNSSLRYSIDKLKAEADSHATSCDSFRKTTKTQLKSLEGLDFTENQVNQNKLNNEINRLSKLCSSLQKQVSNKINAGSSYPDPPRQFSTQAIQVDMNSGLLHLNERKAPNRSDAHANPLVKSADIQVKQQQTALKPGTKSLVSTSRHQASHLTPKMKTREPQMSSSVLHTNEQHAITYMVLQNIQLTMEYKTFYDKKVFTLHT